VGPNARLLAVPGTGWLAFTLLPGKRKDERSVASAMVAVIPAKTIKIHIERFHVGYVRAGGALVRFFGDMDAFVRSAKLRVG
jgi:hypothetical protein